jgi:hypothetical protein
MQKLQNYKVPCGSAWSAAGAAFFLHFVYKIDKKHLKTTK